MHSLSLAALAVVSAFAQQSESQPSAFALRDGDTVVFLGDSITAARKYGKIVEDYTLLRFPHSKIQFYNAGHGGDTAAGGLTRLERDVFIRRPTVLIVAYGINDIGWGVKADAQHKQKYLDSIRGIVEACKKRGVRTYICSAAVTAGDPATGEESFLQKMCDEGMAIARELGEHSIDVQRMMRGIQKKIAESNSQATSKDAADAVSLHVKDGVHLSDLGQVAMAYAILKGLGAPTEVSAVHLDARSKQPVVARGCTVTDLVVNGDQLSFTRHDEGLPFNSGLFFTFHYRFVPIPDEMNRYMLRVENLGDGQYELKVDGRGVGTFRSQQLATGVNIASSTADGWEPGGPWDAQASVLRDVTESRHNLFQSGVMASAYLTSSPIAKDLAAELESADQKLVAIQRRIVQPHPYHFVLQRVEPKAKPK
jgi:lysophospholipase L1-like esterase